MKPTRKTPDQLRDSVASLLAGFHRPVRNSANAYNASPTQEIAQPAKKPGMPYYEISRNEAIQRTAAPTNVDENKNAEAFTPRYSA